MKLTGERCKKLREDKKITSHKKLATELNCGESAIRDLESGRAKYIKGTLILAFSSFFGVSADFILTGKEWITENSFGIKERSDMQAKIIDLMEQLNTPLKKKG